MKAKLSAIVSFLLSLTSVLFVNGGCDNAILNEGQDVSVHVSGLGKQDIPEPFETIDDRFAYVATQVSGFGGLFFDREGRLNIYLQNLDQQVNTAAIIQAFSTSRHLPEIFSKASIRLLQGEYDFAQLRHWKNTAEVLLGDHGVISIDADESKNRVRIGIRNESDEEIVQDALRNIDIPIEAVIFEIIGEAKTAVVLTDKWRPIEGGFEVERSGVSCTHGFHVERSGELGFITNAHCTLAPGGVEGTLFFQDSYVDPSEFIGTETIDPLFNNPSNMNGPPGDKPYRYSDAAYIDYGPNIYTSDINFGKIVRTSFRNQNSSGSRVRNGAFNIVADAWDTELQHIMGLELNKVGRSSGWTYGPISGTCITYEYSGTITDDELRCQYKVDGYSASGDSGSPVFYWSGSGSNTTLYGILWGIEISTSDWIYSPIDFVNDELAASGGILLTHY